MNFKEAFEEMKKGSDIKLPSWKGFWKWNDEKKTIMMHCKDGKVINVFDTEQYEYTLQHLASDEFIIATEENCPLKGGKIGLDFNAAMGYAFKGFKVSYRHEDFDGAGYYLEMDKDGFLELKKTNDKDCVYIPYKTDYESKDWYIMED